ncbi:hypothetical protein HYPSUDRAFT_203297 [Hypholoma sublateritium FD-334 SS-4]|uniref:Uncharacterized protein n=1 Tax=Hypholoma sublateritium (strain FD-334 SS-4) TaxID=945553 RepID=A0A0D2PMN4_HYPSF|nr:hypothetical protein HYPSUDRAFT_203297 [Hypholoma sublateritium FD-334 SS-4]
MDEGYDLDDMNDKGAFNHSRLQIVKTSDLVEPTGWYLGREYYVVTKGLAVGVFHDLLVFMTLIPVYIAYTKKNRSEVHHSVDPFPLLLPWSTCKTWQQAIRMWDTAYRTPGAISILWKPEDAKSATATTAAKASTARRNISAPAQHHVSDSLPLPSATSASTLLVSKRRSVIVISDSDSDSDSDGDSVSNDDSDGEVKSCPNISAPARRHVSDSLPLPSAPSTSTLLLSRRRSVIVISDDDSDDDGVGTSNSSDSELKTTSPKPI